MGIISEPHRSKLYTRVKHLLGAPIRSVELEDEMLDSLLELAIGDYSQYIQDWLIESQWSALQNGSSLIASYNIAKTTFPTGSNTGTAVRYLLDARPRRLVRS